ncbi:LemA family protein [Providencia rettgeri]|uniref:LemA family protein n=1 Tax=Providencia rettgeri TaxID=587 RepID=UPI0034E0AAF4
MEIIIFFLIISVIAYIVIRYFINLYNNMVFLKNNCDKAFANIDVLLKKRVDLLPQLAIIATKAMGHEKAVFEELLQQREQFIAALSLKNKINITNQLPKNLTSIFALAEKYPELVSKNTLLGLQKQVKQIENQIADRREFFNQTVTLYNTEIHQFPNLIFASLFRFKDIPLLYAQQEPK